MSITELEDLIWVARKSVIGKAAKVHELTHTVHYGMGCFEGVRA